VRGCAGPLITYNSIDHDIDTNDVYSILMDTDIDYVDNVGEQVEGALIRQLA
jgi:hypothetical protein